MKTRHHLAFLFVVLGLVAACDRAPGCVNTVSGNSSVAACGGSGDQSGVDTSTPAPVNPVVTTPVPSEVIALKRAARNE